MTVVSERTPLVKGSSEAGTRNERSLHDGLPAHDDSIVEGYTLPEASTLGRKIGWSSAYILVMSRVIGSGQ